MGRMRTLLTPVLLIVLSAGAARADPMTDDDRQRLLGHLRMTESWLTTEVEGLTPVQLRYRMTPESWTIMDVVEHLAVAEPQYWQQLQKSLERPAVQGYKPEATDAGILWYGIDRSRRHKTGEARVPAGRFGDLKESLAAFRTLRATMLEHAKGTGEDLRGRALVDGNMDVYQWYLMISSHAQRHILQIREIKESPGYPRG
jgi:DinB superfamily